jgi:drug/metabolite transporter (DMT)-like permease
MSQQNRTIGWLSAFGVICVWSGFVVFSRAGVTTELTPFDLTGLRFIVAGSITLPFVWAWWPRHLPLSVIVLIAVTGPGIMYSLLMFLGFERASAAYGGVFANGSLPLFTSLIVLAVTGVAPGRWQVLAIALIFCGGALLGWNGMVKGGAEIGAGIALFLGASASLSIYIFALRHWQIMPTQALVLVNLPNAMVFLPIWWFALPKGLAQVDWQVAAFHALYQGLGPGFLAVIFFTLSARHLGATMTAAFSSAVPAVAAVLAIPILGETPVAIEWLGIVVVTSGLAVLVRGQG